MQAIGQPVAECVAVAKRDLAPGETLGKIGETDYRGWAMTWPDARNAHAIPLGIAEGAKIMKPIKAGASLTYDNCTPDNSMVVTQIRQRLDQMDGQFVDMNEKCVA
jgi:predicted homoserine dehydrogenase-like protein